MMTDDNKHEIETHYMLVESIMERFNFGDGLIRKMWRQFKAPEIKFERFYIIDFDNCLNGNPIMEGEGLSDYE